MNQKSLAVDAIPEKLMPDFLKQAHTIHYFWHDMFLLCATFGLRNIECRELMRNQINFKTKTLTLTNTKAEKTRLTKRVNQHLNEQWLLKGRSWLRRHISDPHAALIVRLASSLRDLTVLAQEYQVEREYKQAQQAFLNREKPRVRAQFERQVTASRVIDFSAFPSIERLLRYRCQRYQHRQYLFPRDELSRNRHCQNGDAPLSRQSVYNVVQKIRSQLSTKLKGIRLGLHSCRKLAVQRVASLMKDTFAASVWIGHGNGRGDLAMTERYLNRSQRRYAEVNLKLSKACHNDYSVNE